MYGGLWFIPFCVWNSGTIVFSALAFILFLKFEASLVACVLLFYISCGDIIAYVIFLCCFSIADLQI